MNSVLVICGIILLLVLVVLLILFYIGYKIGKCLKTFDDIINEDNLEF